VADAIGMTRLALDYNEVVTQKAFRFSPDGEQFVFILKTGDIENNANRFSLLRYRTSEAFRSPAPDVLLTMVSTSNRDAIKSVQWLDDNETLAFLGENPEEMPQIHTFNVKTKRVEKLTSHPTRIADYVISGDGREILFTAEPADEKHVSTDRDRHDGMVITRQSLAELLASSRGDAASPWDAKQLFLQHKGQAPIGITVQDAIGVNSALSISPDSRYALVVGWVRDVPTSWASYDDKAIQGQVFQKRRSDDKTTDLMRYLVVDAKDGWVVPLLDVPMLSINPFAWAPDGHSLFMKGTYLPLVGNDRAEQELRTKQVFDVKIDPSTKQYQKITKEDFENKSEKKQRIDVSLDQDLNKPPKIYVLDPTTKKRTLLMDLNPDFENLHFGLAKTIEWKVDGTEVIGGLYLPPDYAQGKRYPLVIQTHGFMPTEFSMDGRSEWSSSFAARPLAAKGFIVLQAFNFKNPSDHDRMLENKKLGDTQAQAAKHFSDLLYQDAIKNLDKQGIIDPQRVGITGFSRTVCFVAYALTHTADRFRAAILTDGTDCGYFQYLAFRNAAEDMDMLNGGVAPFGDGLKEWLKDSPSFSLDKVQAPVRLVALGPQAILESWEWFAGLTLQNKPVDFIEIPDASHIIQRPSDRRIAMQGAVDWFSFWLKGEEDSVPEKRNQYSRWRQLKKDEHAKSSVIPFDSREK